MLFRRRHKRGPIAGRAPVGPVPGQEPEFFRIDFGMMRKGSILETRRGRIRQVGVTVNGSTRLVTSGDLVDRETYGALAAAGIIEDARPSLPPKPLLVTEDADDDPVSVPEAED